MALDWSKVQKLAAPLKTTGSDVIFSGHGKVAGTGTTTVPDGIELWVLAPPGAAIADSSGQALENMDTVTMVGIKNPNSDVLVNNQPSVYRAGQAAPNYVLQAPRGIVIKPGGPHILGVDADTPLQDLWARAKPFIQPSKTLRCFWAACTAMQGASNPVVLVK